MNKEKFLELLAEQLQVLDEKEKQDILDEYALHIDMKVLEGFSEEEAIKDFGELKDLVTDILEAYHVNPEYCTPSKIRKKEWKTPDIGKVKEEGLEVCTKAGGACKKTIQSCGEKFRKGLKKCGYFFRNLEEKVKKVCSRDKNKKEFAEAREGRHMIRNVWCRCKHVVLRFTGFCRKIILWLARVCWNIIWFGIAALFVLGTAVAIFIFGVLIILNGQGYPLTGITIGSFGMILAAGALSGLALSYRRERGGVA